MRTVEVTAPEAANLRCPYTGERLVVCMNIQPGSITFNAPDAFTLKEPVKGMAALIDRASMRNGVAGSVVGGAPVDAYTGEILELRDLGGDMFCYVGGFNPRAACKTLGEFIYRASMRNGKTNVAPPGNPPPVSRFSKPKVLRHRVTEVSEDTLKAADAAIRKSGAFETKTSVHVTRKGKK